MRTLLINRASFKTFGFRRISYKPVSYKFLYRSIYQCSVFSIQKCKLVKASMCFSFVLKIRKSCNIGWLQLEWQKWVSHFQLLPLSVLPWLLDPALVKSNLNQPPIFTAMTFTKSTTTKPICYHLLTFTLQSLKLIWTSWQTDLIWQKWVYSVLWNRNCHCRWRKTNFVKFWMKGKASKLCYEYACSYKL